jgi:hypothetical protein
MPRSGDRGTIAGLANIAGRTWRFRAKHALGLDPWVGAGSREERAKNKDSVSSEVDTGSREENASKIESCCQVAEAAAG